MPIAAQHVVAIDVGGTSLKAAVVDADGQAQCFERRPTRAADGPEARERRPADHARHRGRCAMVIRGQPCTGAHGFGGELGHVAVEPQGPLCGCGRPGCLEAFPSAGHVALRYRAIAGEQAESCTAREVAQRAASGDAIAGAVWRAARDALALAVANYVTLMDPELIVIGGGMAAAGDDLFAPLRYRLEAHVGFGEAPPVVAARLKEEAGRYGAAIGAWRAAGVDETRLSGWQLQG